MADGLHHKHLWLWVPAYAGTTENLIVPPAKGGTIKQVLRLGEGADQAGGLQHMAIERLHRLGTVEAGASAVGSRSVAISVSV